MCIAKCTISLYSAQRVFPIEDTLLTCVILIQSPLYEIFIAL